MKPRKKEDVKMSDERAKEIFSRNLRRYMELKGKTQADMARDLHVSTATASDWCNKKKMPRSDKLVMICQWLGIELNELMAEEEPKGTYYVDQETARIADRIFHNDDLRLLFDAASDVRPEVLKTVYGVLMIMKKGNNE